MATKITDKSGVDPVPSAEWNWIVDLIDGTGVASANLSWAQTTTTGNALLITRNLTAASTDSAVVQITQDHASDDQSALHLTQDGESFALRATHTGDTSGSAAWFENTNKGATTIQTLLASRPSFATGSNYFYRNLASADTAGPLATFLQDNAGDDQSVIRIQQDATTIPSIDFSVGAVAFDFTAAMATSGAGTMAVNNSPGAGATTWIKVQVNGTEGFIPVHYTV